jgi:hypothetical protein
VSMPTSDCLVVVGLYIIQANRRYRHCTYFSIVQVKGKNSG